MISPDPEMSDDEYKLFKFYKNEGVFNKHYLQDGIISLYKIKLPIEYKSEFVLSLMKDEELIIYFKQKIFLKNMKKLILLKKN